jgi:PEP-CTERM motif
MNRSLSCSVAISTVSWLFTLLSGLLYCPSALAQTVVINYTDRGWYAPTGFHDPSNLNYGVGDVRGPSCGVTCYADIRNFFVFDLAGVTQPISSAKLELSVPIGRGYVSPDPSENYELHDVITPIATLVDGTGGVAAHADLGSGVVYGSRMMTAGDNNTVVGITLNSSAIAVLDAATGLIGIGGSLTTLDDLPNDEYTFAYPTTTDSIAQLRLTLVPEPSTLLLLGIGAISLLGYRKTRP